ncbi:MAG: hypothetical protein WCK82_13785 [Bacteroidota bacterium]
MVENNEPNTPSTFPSNNGGGDYKSVDERLGKIKLALDGAISDDAQIELAKFGYAKAEINKGMDLYKDTYTKHEKQKKEYGEQFDATDTLNKARKTANATYMKYMRIARVVFRNSRNEAESLMLNGDRKNSFTGWVEQCRVFYNNALASQSILDALAKKGLTKTMLEAGLASIADVEKANAAQSKEASEAVKATADRDAALDLLEHWFADFRDISFAVLDEKPELIRKMGL